MNNLLIFCVSFLGIFLRAFQQKNVNGNHYILVIPVSVFMATSEVVCWGIVAVNSIENGLFSEQSVHLILSMGIGGGLGCIAAMFVHNKWVKEK